MLCLELCVRSYQQAAGSNSLVCWWWNIKQELHTGVMLDTYATAYPLSK
jgi:hypothetical protein